MTYDCSGHPLRAPDAVLGLPPRWFLLDNMDWYLDSIAHLYETLNESGGWAWAQNGLDNKVVLRVWYGSDRAACTAALIPFMDALRDTR